MHLPLYRTVSTAVACGVMVAGLAAQVLEVERTSAARSASAVKAPTFRRWEPPQGLLGDPASAAESYLTIDR
ncbi:MAG: hypothetical protein IT299_09265 [Dehalococcoidia bacterium]|nr:hypothetical protein [Dehalococcoidia bacterium]